jgi:hypothetical protein
MTDPTALAPQAIFLWGMGGSLAIEILSVYSEVKTPSGMQGVASYYRSIPFWILRVGIAAVAGALAIAEEASKPIIAINIGAAAPAILQLLTRPPGSGGPGTQPNAQVPAQIELPPTAIGK